MKTKRIVLTSLIMLVAASILGGYLWIRFDVPVMEYDHTNVDSVYASWRLDKNGVATVYGSGSLPWLEAEYRENLMKAETAGSFYAFLKRRFDDCPIQKVVIGKDVSGMRDEDGVMSYHNYYLDHCRRLREITVDAENPYLSSADGVLYSKDGAVLLAYPANKKDRSFTVPTGVTTIAEQAFRDSARIVSVTLPEGLRDIQTFAFQYCKRLKNVSLPESLETIGKGSFFACGRLKTVVIPTGVEKIGEYALGFGIKNNPVEDSDVAAVKGFKLLCGENAEAAKEYAETYGIVLKTGGTSK